MHSVKNILSKQYCVNWIETTFCRSCLFYRFSQTTSVATTTPATLVNMEDEQCRKKPRLEEKPVIKEGKAEILVADKKVFYNPVQEFNRDLSVAVLTVFARDTNNTSPKKNTEESKEKNSSTANDANNVDQQNGITVLEALSATGLRSIRYAKEVPGVKHITANDISAKAVESIKQNILHNSVENLVTSSHADATMFMHQNKKTPYDAIDLDPYGCPTTFLDAAVQCVKEGGVLMVTATDMAILAGNTPETCYLKYGAISLKSKACHEIALRILLQNIATHAGRYGRYIVPVLSLSADFYIRVFVKVFTSQITCKQNLKKIGMFFQCTGCESINIQPLCVEKTAKHYKLSNAPCVDQLCKHCQHKQHMGGPIWLDPLHDQAFVSELLCDLENMDLGTKKRIKGVLTVIHEELDVPLYYTVERLMSIVKCHTPPMITFRSALLNAGYKVSFSHANKTSVKTDAPNDVIWDVARAWDKQNPKNRDNLQENSPAFNILNSPSTTEISFVKHPHADPVSRRMHLTRFQLNPAANWGPGMRSMTITDLETKDENSKKIRNQNKKSKKTAPVTSEENENKDKESPVNDTNA